MSIPEEESPKGSKPIEASASVDIYSVKDEE